MDKPAPRSFPIAGTPKCRWFAYAPAATGAMDVFPSPKLALDWWLSWCQPGALFLPLSISWRSRMVPHTIGDNARAPTGDKIPTADKSVNPAILCAICGSSEWIACYPGVEAEPRERDNVCWLKPAAEVPLVAWCFEHWPAWSERAA